MLSLTLKFPGSGDPHLLRPGPTIIVRALDGGIAVHQEDVVRRGGEPPSVESIGSVTVRGRTPASEAFRLRTC